MGGYEYEELLFLQKRIDWQFIYCYDANITHKTRVRIYLDGRTCISQNQRMQPDRTLIFNNTDILENQDGRRPRKLAYFTFADTR